MARRRLQVIGFWRGMLLGYSFEPRPNSYSRMIALAGFGYDPSSYQLSDSRTRKKISLTREDNID